MNDISVAERRLVSALDRLDHTVDRAARRMAAAAQPAPAPPTPAPPPEASGDVSLEIAALHDRQAATLEAMQMRLSEAHERLASAGEQAARLAAANDDLARANRALIEAADSGTGADQATLQALEAEVESLRAARAAEIAQMSEILDALDRMLGVTTTPRSHSTAGRSARARKPAAPPAAKPEPAPEPAPEPVKLATSHRSSGLQLPGSARRERRAWAQAKGLEFSRSDELLGGEWTRGAAASGATPKDIASGTVFGHDTHVMDLGGVTVRTAPLGPRAVRLGAEAPTLSTERGSHDTGCSLCERLGDGQKLPCPLAQSIPL